MKDLIKLITLTLFFTVVIFLVNYFFFADENISYIEDNYIEPSISDISGNNDRGNLVEDKEFNSASKFFFVFIPGSYKNSINETSDYIRSVLKTSPFYDKIQDLRVEFYQNRNDVRGKMKNMTVKLFDPYEMGLEESSSVFIHELAHFIDLYYLERKITLDLSNRFYDISWNSTKVLKANQKGEDFVSGYSMTNKYEDFAETFTYFVLHNDDFLEKTKKSESLKQKYDFMSNYIFKKYSFKDTDFSEGNKVKDYYRDITKIDINSQKFLQFLEK